MYRRFRRWRRALALAGWLVAGMVWAAQAAGIGPALIRGAARPGGVSDAGPLRLRAVIGQPAVGSAAHGPLALAAGWLAPAAVAPSTPTPAPTPTWLPPAATSTPAPPTPPTITATAGFVPPSTATALAAPLPTDSPNACLASVAGIYSAPASGPLQLYLPAVLQAAPGGTERPAGGAPQPDLQTRYELCPGRAAGQWTLRVTILNAGQADTPAAGFWVDAYLNAAQAPARALPWDAACPGWPCFGASWFVAGTLAPGESVTVTDTDWQPDYTVWPTDLAAGPHTLFVYADSYADDGHPAGAVRETNELNNRSDLPASSVGSGAPAADQPFARLPEHRRQP